MKKQVKILSVILSVFMALSLCSCKNGTDGSSSIPFNSSLEVISSSEPISSVEETLSSEPEASSVASEAESKPEPSPTPAPAPVNPPSPPTSSVVGGYTVNDPENTRGLSEVRNGYGFGVASGGKPNIMSVNNQLRFDSLAGVTALALDTVSQDKRMYLTFDCGYEYKNLTASILDTLKAKGVKAAFFCTLDYLEDNPQLVRRMIDEGHIVGNHSATHPDFSTISRTKMANELYLVDKYLQEQFSYKSSYFRFPSGAHSESSLELVTSVGFKSIFWSVAYADWDTGKQPEKTDAFNTITSRYHPGAVILLHAVSATNDAILGDLIDNAVNQGYTFKTLDDYNGM